jgi:hypothetical protein
MPPSPGSTYSFSQLEDLWVQAGGNQADAPVMASVALAESGGKPWNTNFKPPDYSVGLWQINYYGANAAPRTALWGPPTNLYGSSPQQALANAKAAVYLLGQNRSGLTSNWGGDPAVKEYNAAGGGDAGVAALQKTYGGTPSFPGEGPGFSGGVGGEPGVVEPGSPAYGVYQAGAGGYQAVASAVHGTESAIRSTGSFLAKLTDPNFWIRIAEIVGGVMLVGLGLYVTVKDMGGGSSFKLPGQAGEKQDEALQAVRDLELQSRAEAAEARRTQTVNRASTVDVEYEARRAVAAQRVNQARARTRERRASARAAESGATEAKRRAERAKSIQMEDLSKMEMFK